MDTRVIGASLLVLASVLASRAVAEPPPTAADLSYVLSIRDAYEAYERCEIARVRAELAAIRGLGLEGATDRFEFRLIEELASPGWMRAEGAAVSAPAGPRWAATLADGVWTLAPADSQGASSVSAARLTTGESDEDGLVGIVSADGGTVVMGSWPERCGAEVWVWNPSSGADRRPLETSMVVTGACVSPDGGWIALALWSKAFEVFERDGLSRHGPIGLHADASAMAIDSEGRLAVGCDDGSVSIWRLARCGCPHREAVFFAHDGRIATVEFRGSGVLRAATEDGRTADWRLEGASSRLERDGPWLGGERIAQVGFDLDAVELEGVGAWALSTGRRVANPVRGMVLRPIDRTAVSADGRTRATALEDRTVELTDVRTGRRLGFLSDRGPVGSPSRCDQPIPYACLGNSCFTDDDVEVVAFGPDGQSLVAATREMALRWRVGAAAPTR